MGGESATSPAINLKVYEWNCPGCRKSNAPFAKFCANCGRPRPDLIYCENKHPNPPFFRYCSTCGLPLEHEELKIIRHGDELLKPKELLPPPASIEESSQPYVGRPVRGLKLKTPELSKLGKPLKIDEYECRSYLGLGGFSATLLGVDERGVSYVLKIPRGDFDNLVLRGSITILPQLAEDQRRAFNREREVLEKISQLNHPCIVKFVRALEPTRDRPLALIFEYCEGGSLRDILQQGSLGPRCAAEIVIQLADAIRRIHELGYVHGDIKPENILFTRDGIPRLADYNSTRLIAAVVRSRIPITFGYSAPEQLRNIITLKSDVWSLALVLYEAATGRPLLPLDEISYQEKIAELEAGGKLEVNTGDPELDRVIASCLSVDPDKRPSMKEFEWMLLEYLHREGRP